MLAVAEARTALAPLTLADFKIVKHPQLGVLNGQKFGHWDWISMAHVKEKVQEHLQSQGYDDANLDRLVSYFTFTHQSLPGAFPNPLIWCEGLKPTQSSIFSDAGGAVCLFGDNMYVNSGFLKPCLKLVSNGVIWLGKHDGTPFGRHWNGSAISEPTLRGWIAL